MLRSRLYRPTRRRRWFWVTIALPSENRALPAHNLIESSTVDDQALILERAFRVGECRT